MQEFNWQPMNPEELLNCSGIYGIYLPSLEQWFYVGGTGL